MSIPELPEHPEVRIDGEKYVQAEYILSLVTSIQIEEGGEDEKIIARLFEYCWDEEY